MDWVRGLPAVLRDKKYFLVKRRRSIRASAAETQQKKPTTANRRRLEAGIADARTHLPRVYADSVVLPDEMSKYPLEGEQEMSEQHESVDLAGEVHLSQEVFVQWFNSGASTGTNHHCAAILNRYAVDQQGMDLRGGVTGDTAWELCCRLLSVPANVDKLATREIAQLIVYWLEEKQVPSQMGESVYQGMVEELQARGKRVETLEDEQLMKCRWIRQAIHWELDVVREQWAHAGHELATEFEILGELLQGEQQPANLEAEKEALSLLEHLRLQQQQQRTLQSDREGSVRLAPDEWLEGEPEPHDLADDCVSSTPSTGPAVVGCDPALAAVSGPHAETTGHAVAPAEQSSHITNQTLSDKPVVEPPEFGDRVRDTDKDRVSDFGS
jgi:hypothetical protein